MAKVPKCRFCEKTHYGNCAPVKERRVAPANRAAELSAALDAGEHMIKRGWMLIGRALTEIKADKHYITLGFENFGALCESRGYTVRRGNQLIEAVEMGEDLGKILPDLPDSESAVRALAEVQRDEGDDAVRDVVAASGPKPTTGKIKSEAKKRKASKEPAEQPKLEPTYAIEQPCTHENAKCLGCGEKGKLA